MNCLTRDHPRLRGEYPYKPGDPIRLMGITPACAGNTAGGAPDLRCNRDHPRLRGEYLFQRYNGLHSAGSPPLARGILISASDCGLLDGITPACAGNTFLIFAVYPFARDHPRLRGEYLFRFVSSVHRAGSPPLARGIRGISHCCSGGQGITPACAGNTNSEPFGYPHCRDHPRLRGEYTKRIPYLQHFSTLCR